MKRLLLLAAILAAPVLARDAPPGEPLVAADREFAAMARSKGEWTALRAFADPRGEIFVPRRVKIREFGRDLADPPKPARWQPDNAWIACDGSVGVTEGRWKPSGKSAGKSRYLAIWVREPDGAYRLILRHAGAAPRLLGKASGRKGARASCQGRPGVPLRAPAPGVDFKLGAARDQTLIWTSAADPKGGLEITVALWDGAAHRPVLAVEQSTASLRP